MSKEKDIFLKNIELYLKDLAKHCNRIKEICIELIKKLNNGEFNENDIESLIYKAWHLELSRRRLKYNLEGYKFFKKKEGNL